MSDLGFVYAALWNLLLSIYLWFHFCASIRFMSCYVYASLALPLCKYSHVVYGLATWAWCLPLRFVELGLRIDRIALKSLALKPLR